MSTNIDCPTVAQKYGYELNRYPTVIKHFYNGFKKAGETFDYRKEGYLLSKQRSKLLKRHLDELYDEIIPGSNRKHTIKEIYDMYNTELLAYWSFLQYCKTPSQGSNWYTSPLMISSMTFEFRDHALNESLNAELPFERSSLIWCTDLINEIKSGLIQQTVDSTDNKSKLLTFNNGRSIKYNMLSSNLESPEMYSYPLDWLNKEGRNYINALTKNPRSITTWVSENVLKAWQLTAEGKGSKQLDYSALEYAQQIFGKTEFRLHSLIDTNSEVISINGTSYKSKIAVLVSGEAQELQGDLPTFDGKMNRFKLNNSLGNSSFFHKTFGFGDVMIVLPYDLVPLYFKTTYPFGLLYDYQPDTYPKEIFTRNQYAIWYNLKNFGYYTAFFNSRNKITSYYMNRLYNTLFGDKQAKSLELSKTDLPKNPDDENLKNFIIKDRQAAEKIEQFIPLSQFRDYSCWPYDENIRDGLKIIHLFTCNSDSLRIYFGVNPKDNYADIMDSVWKDTGYIKIVEKCKRVNDISSRFNVSFLAGDKKFLVKYNKKKFKNFQNTEITNNEDQQISTGLDYHIYKDEIRMLCGRYSYQTVTLNTKNVVLAIGSKIMFSRSITLGLDNRGTKHTKALPGRRSKLGVSSNLNEDIDEDEEDDEDDLYDDINIDDDLSNDYANNEQEPGDNYEGIFEDGEDDEEFVPNNNSEDEEMVDVASEDEDEDNDNNAVKKSNKRKWEYEENDTDRSTKRKKTKAKFYSRIKKITNTKENNNNFFVFVTNGENQQLELKNTEQCDLTQKFNGVSLEDSVIYCLYKQEHYEEDLDKIVIVYEKVF